MRSIGYAVLIVLLVAAACSTRDKKGNFLDTTTSGSVKIAVDESLKPLFDTEVDTFESLYTRAKIEVIYTSEEDAINQLLADSVRLAIITRSLLPLEEELFAKKILKPTQIAVAKEGIGLIVNNSNPDSLLTVAQLRDILTGKISNWKQLNPKSPSQTIEVVFDQPTSGILRFLKDSLKIDSLPSNCFAVNGNPAVVDHIASKKNALGLIGVTWINDEDDSTANEFLSRVRVVAMGDSVGGEYYHPFQGYIAQGQYPLIRKIRVINPEGRAGLGSGFLAFVTGEKGQRIILKAGLVPVTMPIRIIDVNRDPL
jgi:phosphate transport system substrate-binding protein